MPFNPPHMSPSTLMAGGTPKPLLQVVVECTPSHKPTAKRMAKGRILLDVRACDGGPRIGDGPRVVGVKAIFFLRDDEFTKLQNSVEFIYAVWSYGCRNLLSIKGVCARAYVIDLVFKVCVCGHVCACAGMCACACTCECVCDKSNLDSFQSFLLSRKHEAALCCLVWRSGSCSTPACWGYEVAASTCTDSLECWSNQGASKCCFLHFPFLLSLSFPFLPTNRCSHPHTKHENVHARASRLDQSRHSFEFYTTQYIYIYGYIYIYIMLWSIIIISYSTAKLQSSYNLIA